nr:hypothetical protein [Tanacetum cinerariifolium]
EDDEDEEDDEMDVEADEEEEEHPAPADSLVLSSASRREDRQEVTLPPRKRLGIALGPRYQGQVTALQAQVTTLQGQQGLAGEHTQSKLPEEASGSA